jgi:hypothetical protein
MHNQIAKDLRPLLALAWLTGGVVIVSCQAPVQPSAPADSPFNHPCAASNAPVSASTGQHESSTGAAFAPLDAPLAVLANYAGAWTGQYHITTCLRICGLGPDVCKEELANGGAVYAFDTMLSQNDLAVDGKLNFYDNTGDVVIETGHVTGLVDAGNVLALSGTTVTTDPSEPRQTSLAGWSTTLTDGGAAMAGRFTRNQNFTNAWGPQQFKIDCELTNVRRRTQ